MSNATVTLTRCKTCGIRFEAVRRSARFCSTRCRVAAHRRRKSRPHVANNSGEQEWYTPTEFLESARKVLGEIELDPATSEVAQRSVKATKYFTKDDDGLAKQWSGNIWMNPPYASGLVDRFAEKLIESLGSGAVESAIVLVNNATDTRWFHLLESRCSAVCLVRGRIKFLDTNGQPSGRPLQGQAFLYFGPNHQSFRDEFMQWGSVRT